MFTHSRLVGMAVGLLLALVCTSGVAYAADAPDYADPTVVQGIMQGLETADDPQQAFSQLPPAAQQVAIDFLTVTSVETKEEFRRISGYLQAGGWVSAASGPSCGCGVHIKSEELWAGPVKVAKYISKTSWCWDGVYIDGDPFFNAYGWVYQPLWEFVGNQRTNESGGDGDRVHSDFAQGHFRMCLGAGGCIAHLHPVIEKKQYGDGRKE